MRKANDVEMKYRERVTSWIMTDVYLDSLVTYVDHAQGVFYQIREIPGLFLFILCLSKTNITIFTTI